ncbi:lipocalin family protein [Nocardia halotolerans]|uniref:Lipocalin family protein n=1 Tax=Nocardia halotolerans TaxID=1755878 RepID=A0ABV8VAB3_9NOCA
MKSHLFRAHGRQQRWAVPLGLAVIATIALPPGPAVANPGSAPATGPVPVAQVELDRYLGTWRQLAAVPQVFNLSCARDTTAEYRLDERGDIAVRNSCVTWQGSLNEIHGTATVNDEQTGAQLHVSFPGVPGQDQRYGPTNYIVTELGVGYSWALVTDPSRLSGFVLARDSTLDPATWDQVRAAIARVGQSPCAYLTSPTSGGISGIAPLCTQ